LVVFAILNLNRLELYGPVTDDFQGFDQAVIRQGSYQMGDETLVSQKLTNWSP